MTFTATAEAQVSLQAPNLPEEVREDIEATSLSFEIDEAEESTVQDLVAAAQADYGRVVAILYENGYFAPVVNILVNGQEASGLSPVSPPPQIDSIIIAVEPGEVFRFGTAEIGPITPDTALPEAFASGEVATTPVLRQAADEAVLGWRQDGHAAARIEDQQITARNAQAVLDARIDVTPGPVVTFGQLLPQGQERMRTERILEIAGLPVGEVYSPAALDLTADRLRRTGVFSVVALEETALNADNSMDVVAILDEFPPRRFGFGAEYSTIDGGALSAFWLHRNLFGGAERLRFDAEVSGLGGQTGGTDYLLATRFTRPATFNPETSLEIEVALERLEDPAFTLNTADVVVSLERIFTERLTASAGLGLAYADIEDAFGEREILLFTLPLEATYDARNSEADPTRGYYLEADVQPFVSDAGVFGAYALADLRGYVGFGEENRTSIAGRLQLGALVGAERDEVPSDYLFLSGGGGTVRGQSYQSLGVDEGGDLTGGRGFVGASAEIRQRIGERFGAVAFADFGYISEGPLGDSDGASHAGAGLGVRYFTPIGPVRLDIAVPVTGDDAGEEAILYIGIGQSF